MQNNDVLVLTLEDSVPVGKESTNFKSCEQSSVLDDEDNAYLEGSESEAHVREPITITK